MGHRLNTFLTNTALAAVAFAFALGCAEVVVRLLAPQQLIDIDSSIWQPTDTVGYLNRPNLQTTINWGEGRVALRTDRDGYRVSRAGRVEGRKHILLIGDSFMEALQVEYEESVAGLLETRLAAVLGEPVAVRNTGVNGWDPGQYLAEARRVLPRDHFDLALVSMFLGNDVLDRHPEYQSPRPLIPPHRWRVPRHLRWSEFVTAVLYPANDLLEQHSQLFVFARWRMRTLLMRVGLTPLLVPEELLRPNATSRRWAATADVCQRLAAAAARSGVPTLFMLIPSNYQVDPGIATDFLEGFGLDPNSLDLDQPNRLLGAEMTARGLQFIDLLTPMRAERARGKRLYGRVDAHLSAEGHDVVERRVEGAVLDLLRRPTSARPR